MSSFKDTTPQEAIEALGSALRGESEPIRRYDVLLNETAVSAKALELGLVGAGGQLDEAAKVQARYALILEQTNVAQGDFLATQDSLSNRLKTTRKDFLELRRELGEAVVPALEGALEAFPAVVDAVRELAPVLGDTASALGELAGTLGPVAAVVGATAGKLLEFRDVLNDLSESENIFVQKFGDVLDFFGLTQSAAGFAADTFARFGEEGEQATSIIAGGQLPDYITQTGEASVDAASQLALYGDEYAGVADEIVSLESIIAGSQLPDFIAEFDEGVSRANRDLPSASEGLRLYGDAYTDLADQVAESETELIGSVENTISTIRGLANTEDPFTALENDFAAAADAFETTQGDIVDSFATFVDQLNEESLARAEFDANLAELGRRGFDDLAKVFLEKGPEAASLLAQALDDPAAAAEAESVLQGNAESQAQIYLDTFGAAIAGGDLTADYIQQLQRLAEAAESGTVQNTLIAAAKDLALLFAANFNPQILIDDFDISLPSNVVAANVGGDLLGSGTPSTATSSGAQFATQVININNATTEDVETSAAQAAQTLGAISGLVN